MHGRAPALLLAASVVLLLAVLGPSVVQASPSTPLAGLGVSLSATPSYGSAPLSVDFQATVASGTPTAYNWTFGDGTFLNGTNASVGRPSHVYTSPGSYTASVRVWEGTDVGNASIPVHAITSALALRVNATPLSGVVPLTVDFAGAATGGTETYVAFNWTFGDGGTGSGSAVKWTYERSGSFYAELTVEDSGSDEVHEGVWVNVSAAPVPSVPSQVTGLGTLGWTVVGFAIGLVVAVLAVFGRAWLSSRRAPYWSASRRAQARG
jgi:PKD repeat protein